MNGNKTTITVQGAPLSQLFLVSERRKQELEEAYAAEEKQQHQQPQPAEPREEPLDPVRRITEYALSQCSLEQVFLRIGLLARRAEEEEESQQQQPQQGATPSGLTDVT